MKTQYIRLCSHSITCVKTFRSYKTISCICRWLTNLEGSEAFDWDYALVVKYLEKSKGWAYWKKKIIPSRDSCIIFFHVVECLFWVSIFSEQKPSIWSVRIETWTYIFQIWGVEGQQIPPTLQIQLIFRSPPRDKNQYFA